MAYTPRPDSLTWNQILDALQKHGPLLRREFDMFVTATTTGQFLPTMIKTGVVERIGKFPIYIYDLPIKARKKAAK